MVNLLFHYMYRDGANYKMGGNVILDGVPEDMGQYEKELKAVLDDGEYFIAHQVDVPEKFHYTNGYGVDDDDHSWHKFEYLEAVEDEPTDERTPEQFLETFKKASEDGWEEFDPADR